MKAKLNAVLLSCFVVVGLALGARATVSLAEAVGSTQNPTGVEARIKGVENSLLPPVIYKNQPLPTRTLEAAMKEYGTVGLSIAVVDNYELAWTRTYGVADSDTKQPVTAETLFQAGSVSKAVTAVIALHLVEQGKLKLDEDVNLKLKSWKAPESEFTKTEKVTLRRLLTHTSGMTVHGFRGYAPGAPLPLLVQILKGENPPANSPPIRVDFVPGSRWRYSGGGMMVVQQLLEDVTQKSFQQLAKEIIFDRIGMERSYFLQPLPPELATTAAAGHEQNGRRPGRWQVYPELAPAGLCSTPSDLARFIIELQKAKLGKSNKMLSKAMVEQMLSPQHAEMGLGVMLSGSKLGYFEHEGLTQGFKTHLIGSLEGGRGAVVMFNSFGQSLQYELLRAVAKEYNWPDYLPKARVVAKLDAKILAAYEGTYTNVVPDSPLQRLLVEQRDGRLFIGSRPERMEEMLAESGTEFFTARDGDEVTFSREATGQITGLTQRAIHHAMSNLKFLKAKAINR
ncbi:MAG: serine hydrolase [Acidobacteria bacterium]|nr:serine hydrolase [Acidobacteriota bacterium]